MANNVRKRVPANKKDRALKHVRRLRTQLPKIALPVLIIVEMLRGKKPLSILPPDITAVATVGLILILAGIGIRIWARGHFVKGLLFQTGPYAIVRHPLYVGSFLMLIGFLLILNMWVLWVVLLPFYVVFYVLTVISEESGLKRKIGEEWEEYRRSVPALIPMPWKVKAKNIHGWSKEVFSNTPELETIASTVILLVLIELGRRLLF
ncbi:MAG: isoprenylcysteine carboxylmethyltransferase family protein [Thermodesulfobacteriota bacterium]